MDDAVDDRDGSDPEGERQNGDAGEARRAGERAGRVLQVASSVLQPHKRPRVALNEPGLFNSSECAAGRGARIGGRKPASEKALLEHRQVCGNFPGELTFGLTRPDGVEDP